VLAAEHPFRFAGSHLRLELVERAHQVVEHGFTGLAPFDEHGEVVDARLERVAEIAILFQAAPALEQLLRRFLVLPEVGFAYARFDAFEFFCRAGGVKDSSAGPSRGARGLRICGAARLAEATWQW
jgi:hypothetical protein